MRRLLTLALTTALFAALAAPAMARPDFSQKSDTTIAGLVLEASGPDWTFDEEAPFANLDDNPNDYDVLLTALFVTGAVDLLNGTDWTVFAPNDQAFINTANRLGLGDFEATDEGPATLAILDALPTLGLELIDVLKYHLTDGVRNSKSVINPPFVEMLDTNTISVDGNAVITDGLDFETQIVAPDIRVADGIVHVIDHVLVPPLP